MRKVGNLYEVNSNRRHTKTWIHLGWSDPLFVNHSFKYYQEQILLGWSDPLFVNHSFKSCQTQILLGRSNPLFLNHSLEHCQMLHFSLDILMCLNSVMSVTSFDTLGWFSFLMSHGELLAIPRQGVIRIIRKIKITNENNLGKEVFPHT